MPPEYKKRIQKEITPSLALSADAFAIGMMVCDVLTNFTFWESIENSSTFCDYGVPFKLPPMQTKLHF